MYSPKTAAMNFIHEMSRVRSAGNLEPFMAHLVTVLNQHAAAGVTATPQHLARKYDDSDSGDGGDSGDGDDDSGDSGDIDVDRCVCFYTALVSRVAPAHALHTAATHDLHSHNVDSDTVWTVPCWRLAPCRQCW